jgi:HIV Tat-specific factor 1
LQAECEKFGPIEKIKFFEYNPDGVVAIKFEEHDPAERFIEKTNGRFFGGRKLEALFYDGFANYYVEESEEHKKKRLADFEKWVDDS